MFSSCFGFDSALKTKDALMFFWSVFLKTYKKSYRPSKTPFWPFFAVNNNFLCFFKKTDQITFVRLLFLELKTNEKSEDKFFTVLILKLKNALFGVQPIFS